VVVVVVVVVVPDGVAVVVVFSSLLQPERAAIATIAAEPTRWSRERVAVRVMDSLRVVTVR
jgi:hypothetical protein